MFQYWVGRYIADQLGWPLTVYSGDYGQIFLSSRDYPQLRIENIQKCAVADDAWEQKELDTNELNIEKVVADHRVSGQPIYLCKQMESFHLMQPYMTYIQALYCRDVEKVDRIAIHMRLGDLAHINGPLNNEYIQFACGIAQEHPTKPVLIVSEDSESPLTRDMFDAIQRSHSGEVMIKRTHYGSYQEDSDCLTSSTIIVSTNSTFSWWAAMLSKHATAIHVFLHDKQFCNDMRMQMIYPKDILPKHWHLG